MSNRQLSFYFVVMVLLVGLMAARTPLDSDLWWHLRAGKDTLAQFSPVITDNYSYTRTGSVWTNHSWLAQVILYGAYSLANYWGISIVVVALVMGAMGLVFWQMSGVPILRAFLMILGSLTAAVVWVPRPQIFSFFLFALVQWIVYLFRNRGKDWLIWLPVIFVFWSNLHGGYPLGIFLLCLVAGGEIINHLPSMRVDPLMKWGSIWKLASITLLCSGVVVLNPNGIQMWLIPFQTVNVAILGQLISEWASPDFHELYQQPFLWLVILTMFLMGVAGRKVHASDLLLLCGFAFLGFTARRNFGPFALVVLPILSILITELYQKFFPAWEDASETRSISWVNLTIAAILGVFVVVKGYITAHPVLVEYYERQSFPLDSVQWIKQQKPEGRLFNSYNWGGYLTWKLPEYPVFVDGRTDLFGDEILKEWIYIVDGDPDWKEKLDHWQVNVVLIEPHQGLSKVLVQSGWVLLYQDQISVIYARKGQ